MSRAGDRASALPYIAAQSLPVFFLDSRSCFVLPAAVGFLFSWDCLPCVCRELGQQGYTTTCGLKFESSLVSTIGWNDLILGP